MEKNTTAIRYDFEPIIWDNSLAYNKRDYTIRKEANSDIPWGREKWQTTNCIEHTHSTQKQVWDKDKKELVWINTPDVVYFAGMTKDEQEKLVPIVAKGLTAMLIRSARCCRGRWFIENETEVCEQYRKAKEKGLPFNEEELNAFVSDEVRYFYDYENELNLAIPSDLLKEIKDAISHFSNKPISGSRDADLLNFFKTPKGYDEFMERIEANGTPPKAYHIGEVLKEDVWLMNKMPDVTKEYLYDILSSHYGKDIGFYNKGNTKGNTRKKTK